MNKLTRQTKEQTEKNAGEWIENYARIGIAAKGVVYILVGILAALTVFGAGGKNGGRKGAFQLILEQPFGQILLALTVLALLGYVVWRMIQTFKDPDGNGSDTEGIMKRAGFFISGLIYLFFAFSGIRMLLPELGSNGGNGGDDNGGGRQLLVAKALEQPFGQWLVAIGAALVIGKGCFQLYKAYSGKFNKRIKEDEMSEKERITYLQAGRVGYTARGLVMGIVGYFLVRAALNANPDEAQGTEGALDFLSTSTGPYLMALVAVGLACYGGFMFVKARYRNIPKLLSSYE